MVHKIPKNLNIVEINENYKKSFDSVFWYKVSLFCHMILDSISHREVLLRTGALKICTKFTGEHPSEVRFQKSCKETLFKSHFCMGILQ